MLLFAQRLLSHSRVLVDSSHKTFLVIFKPVINSYINDMWQMEWDECHEIFFTNFKPRYVICVPGAQKQSLVTQVYL